jgi:hypothetical protein
VLEIALGVVASLISAPLIYFLARAHRRSRQLPAEVRRRRAVAKRLAAAGVSNMYASREDYVRHRGAPRLTDYLATATTTVQVCGHWLASGSESENVARCLADLVDERRDLYVTVAIMSPDGASLDAAADYFGLTSDDLTHRLTTNLNALLNEWGKLSSAARERYSIRTYDTLPLASVVMLDADTDRGRIQLDFKPYRAPRADSLGIELVADTPLFETWRKSTSFILATATPASRLSEMP